MPSVLVASAPTDLIFAKWGLSRDPCTTVVHVHVHVLPRWAAIVSKVKVRGKFPSRGKVGNQKGSLTPHPVPHAQRLLGHTGQLRTSRPTHIATTLYFTTHIFSAITVMLGSPETFEYSLHLQSYRMFATINQLCGQASSGHFPFLRRLDPHLTVSQYRSGTARAKRTAEK